MGLLDTLLSKYGGDLNKLVGQLSSSGLAEKADSWVGTGKNEPISGTEMKKALGDKQLDDLAQQAGVSPDEAANELAQKLPRAVDTATPAGNIPGIDQVRAAFGKLSG